MDAFLRDKAERLAREMASQATTLDDRNGLMRAMMKSAVERMRHTERDPHLIIPAASSAPTKGPGSSDNLFLTGGDETESSQRPFPKDGARRSGSADAGDASRSSENL